LSHIPSIIDETAYLRNSRQHFSLIKTCIQNAGDNLKESRRIGVKAARKWELS